MGTNPSHFSLASCYAVRPLENKTVTLGNSGQDENSFLGKIRSKTGLLFDLPTEAQWEYACRAGTTTALNSGRNLSCTSNDVNMAVVGRYGYNYPSGKRGGDYDFSDDLSSGSAAVGSYLPNNWGLYDMHGNVREQCLDWYVPSLGTSPVTDPVEAESTSRDRRYVYRGGMWASDAAYCRSAERSVDGSLIHVYAGIGFRLCCPAGLPSYNLTPLRSLLANLEAFTPDGVLADDELRDAMINPTLADLDGDTSRISDDEMVIFVKIQEFNVDKQLITNVIRGNYATITESQLQELAELSDRIKRLTDSN